MNRNKAARIINRIFQIGFFLCMALVFFGTFFYGYTKRIDTNTFGDLDPNRKLYGTRAHLLIYLAAFLLLVFFIGLYICSARTAGRLSTGKRLSSETTFRIILFAVIGVMLAIELYLGWEMRIYRSHDLQYVSENADTFALTGSFQDLRERISSGKDTYMARYPNNFAIMFFLALLDRVWYLLFGSIPLYAPVVVNCLAISISVLFTVLIAKQLWGRRKAIFVLCMLFIFSPLYLYVPLYYTDTLSMPFGVFGVYLFLLAVKKDKSHRTAKYIQLITAGAILFIGYKVKGSIGVIFAVILLYSLLRFNIKQFACIALAMIIGFGSFLLMFKAGYSYLNIVSEEASDRYEYPMTHWVMMGMEGLGGYNKKDRNFTNRIEGKQEKTEANIRVIKERLYQQVTEHTLIKRLANKALWMWTDGTYGIPGHLKTYVHRCPLHDVFLRGGKYYQYYFGYASAYQLVLVFLMMISALKGIIRHQIDQTVLLRLIVLAFFVFLLIWEGRSRYLFHMSPFYILVAADGVFGVTGFAKRLFERFHKKNAALRFIEEEATHSPDKSIVS